MQNVAKDNRAGNDERYHSENLLREYLGGRRINPELFNGFVSTGCHQLVWLF